MNMQFSRVVFLNGAYWQQFNLPDISKYQAAGKSFNRLPSTHGA